jgi:hypothetical protein
MCMPSSFLPSPPLYPQDGWGRASDQPVARPYHLSPFRFFQPETITTDHFDYKSGSNDCGSLIKVANQMPRQQDSHCPYLTAKGTGLAGSAGKEDPIEPSLTLCEKT